MADQIQEERIKKLRETLQNIVDGFFGSAAMRFSALNALEEDSKIAAQYCKDSGDD